MEKIKRSIFFWTLVVLFLITTPIIVLNAKGYHFDLKRGVFVHSGSIVFKSNPQNVDVKLNNAVIKSTKINRINGSTNLTGLMPNDYDIQISAENFQTWNKKITVHSGMAQEFWNVLLVRNEYERINYDTPNIEKFFISPKNDLIAYIEKLEKYITLKTFNIENEIIESNFILPENWQFADDSKKENIEWSPNQNFVSIPTKRSITSEEATTSNKKIEANLLKISNETIKDNYFIIDFNDKSIIDLNEITKKKNIRSVRWDPEKNGFLFFLSENILYQINVKIPLELITISENVSSYDLSGKYVYYFNLKNNLLFRKNLNENLEIEQITSSFPEVENTIISRMIVYDDLRIALISDKKDIFIYNIGGNGKYFKKIGTSIEGVSFSNDGKKLLFWSNNEISVYFLRDEISQPSKKENEIQNITRFSEPIGNIHWFSNYEHIIFNAGKFIKIIEIDPRDRINCMDITTSKTENSMIVYNDYLEKLYFTDINDSNIMNLYSINFPEKNSFFGITQ